MTLQMNGVDENGKLKVAFVGKAAQEYPGKVLILAGACNRVIGEEHQRRHHMKLFSQPELKVLEGTGHMMIEEKPQEVLAVLRAYLDEEGAN